MRNILVFGFGATYITDLTVTQCQLLIQVEYCQHSCQNEPRLCLQSMLIQSTWDRSNIQQVNVNWFWKQYSLETYCLIWDVKLCQFNIWWVSAKRHNSTANSLELCLSCTNPLICASVKANLYCALHIWTTQQVVHQYRKWYHKANRKSASLPGSCIHPGTGRAALQIIILLMSSGWPL